MKMISGSQEWLSTQAAQIMSQCEGEVVDESRYPILAAKLISSAINDQTEVIAENLKKIHTVLEKIEQMQRQIACK
jgi:hypothetical protein